MPSEPSAKSTSKRKDSRPPQTAADEKSTLVGFLDYLRESIAAKAEDAPEPAVRTAGVASGTSVLGLVKHLTYVERFYFLGEDVQGLVSHVAAGARGHGRRRRRGVPGSGRQGEPGHRLVLRSDPHRAECFRQEATTFDALAPGPHDRGNRPPRLPRRHPPRTNRRRHRPLVATRSGNPRRSERRLLPGRETRSAASAELRAAAGPRRQISAR